jgi:hypothetical protein
MTNVDVGEGGDCVDPYSDSPADVALHKWLGCGLVHKRLHFGCDSTHRVEEKSQISSVAPRAF